MEVTKQTDTSEEQKKLKEKAEQAYFDEVAHFRESEKYMIQYFIYVYVCIKCIDVSDKRFSFKI